MVVPIADGTEQRQLPCLAQTAKLEPQSRQDCPTIKMALVIQGAEGQSRATIDDENGAIVGLRGVPEAKAPIDAEARVKSRNRNIGQTEIVLGTIANVVALRGNDTSH
jgi:hypothetical protein